MDEVGNIYARGTQDMKSVGIQYLEAIRRLKLNGVKLKRTVHVSFVPDEEIGGSLGMRKLVKSNYFKNMNVAFSLDEGKANPADKFFLSYGERSNWNILIRCTGKTGHSALLMNDTAAEKMRYIIDKFMDFRAKEEKRLANTKLMIGDVTTVNLVNIEVISLIIRKQ